MEESCVIDYDGAWNEVNSGGGVSEAVDEYVQQVVQRHREDKQAALEQQYEAFERYIHSLTAGGYVTVYCVCNYWQIHSIYSHVLHSWYMAGCCNTRRYSGHWTATIPISDESKDRVSQIKVLQLGAEEVL